MDPKFDPKNVLTVMHHKAVSDVLNLLDGFYSNIEDGIFELAYRSEDEEQQAKCFNLMREMRFRRSRLIQTFARKMQHKKTHWLVPARGGEPEGTSLSPLAERMARKSGAHFDFALKTMAERAASATGYELHPEEIPIGPLSIAQSFVDSCQALQFDKQALEVVRELFCRFVLDRLGPVYGFCNGRLEEAGYPTRREEEELASTA